MKSVVRAVAVGLAVLVSGCGFEVSTTPKELDGEKLAARANRQLEAQNPGMAPGELTCEDVAYEKDATARCVRTVVFDDGRLVRIGATVTIEDVEGEGRFGITVDEAAEEFGVTGRSVFEELANSYERRFGDVPTGACPEYLPGKVGESMTCTLQTNRGRLRVRVEVTRVRPETFETQYTYESLS